jgi:excisionase family DNA binding protein
VDYFPEFSHFQMVREAVDVMDADILTIKEVAGYLKLNEKTAYRLAAGGELPGFKVGGSWRFRRDEIEKLTKRKSLSRKSNAS